MLKKIKYEILDCFYRNFISINNPINVKELYEKVNGDQFTIVKFLQILDDLKHEKLISPLGYIYHNLKLKDKISITLEGLLFYELMLPFYER